MALLLLSGESVRNLIWILAQISQKLMSHETKGVQSLLPTPLEKKIVLHQFKGAEIHSSTWNRTICNYILEHRVAPVTRDVNLEDCHALLFFLQVFRKLKQKVFSLFFRHISIFNDTLRNNTFVKQTPNLLPSYYQKRNKMPSSKV